MHSEKRVKVFGKLNGASLIDHLVKEYTCINALLNRYITTSYLTFFNYIPNFNQLSINNYAKAGLQF
jgi:hypothetical protein